MNKNAVIGENNAREEQTYVKMVTM